MKILSFFFLLFFINYTAVGQEQPKGIIITGSAEVEVDNDIATFLVTLSADGTDPDQARANMHPKNESLQSVIQSMPTLRKKQTLQLTIEPVWFHPRDGSPRRITSYRAQLVTMLECAAGEAAVLASKLSSLNPESLQGPNFAVSKELRKAHELTLLEAATDDAIEKADVLANASSMRRGLPSLLQANSNWSQPSFNSRASMDMVLGAPMESAPPMVTESGRQNLQSNVTAHFELLEPIE